MGKEIRISRRLAPGGGACQNSLATKLTFDFSGQNVTLPADGKVVWTVAFDTSTAGYNPIGVQPCSATDPGCPYDSLNVGVMTFPGAPYAGTDTVEDEAFRSFANNALQAESGWTGFTPLGAITTT